MFSDSEAFEGLFMQHPKYTFVTVSLDSRPNDPNFACQPHQENLIFYYWLYNAKESPNFNKLLPTRV